MTQDTAMRQIQTSGLAVAHLADEGDLPDATAPGPPISGTPLADPSSLRLTEHLAVHPQRDDPNRFIVEDTAQSKFYRLGEAETNFIRCLLANRSVEKARCDALGENPDASEHARAICLWLIERGLAVPESEDRQATPATMKNIAFGPSNGQVPKPSNCSALRRLAQLYFIRIPLGNPDRILTAISERISWLFKWQVALAGVALACLVMVLTLPRRADFFYDFSNLFSTYRWLTWIGAWLALKLVHEMAHACTCKRYGGSVPKCGIAMILFFPIAFVDVTSSWRFDSRFKRLHVTLAGVMAELAVSGMCVAAWHFAESPTLRMFLADIVMMATIGAVAFNLNPLFKFDGYFALADLTGVDNLHALGGNYAKYWGARYLLGLRVTPPALPDGHAWWIRVYGILAVLWRSATLLGLIVAAAALFHGAGIVLAAIGVVAFIVLPAIQLIMFLVKLARSNQLASARLAIRSLLLLSLLLGIACLIPMQSASWAPGIVEYDPPALLRAPVAGFVEKVHVRSGQPVVAGDPIATLTNEHLQLEAIDLETKLQQTEQLLRAADALGDSSQYHALRTEFKGLKQQYHEIQGQIDELVLRAPVAGNTVARHLNSLTGSYVEAGQLLAEIGVESKKRIKLALSPWQISRAQQWRSQKLSIHVPGLPVWQSQLVHLETRASSIPLDESLTAPYGGPLPVMQGGDEQADQLCQPHVTGAIALDAEHSQRVRSGQRCWIKTDCAGQSLAGWLLEQCRVLQFEN